MYIINKYVGLLNTVNICTTYLHLAKFINQIIEVFLFRVYVSFPTKFEILATTVIVV